MSRPYKAPNYHSRNSNLERPLPEITFNLSPSKHLIITLLICKSLALGAAAPQHTNHELLQIDDRSSERVAFGAAPTAVLERFFSELKERIPETGLTWIDEASVFGAPRAYYRHFEQRDGSVAEALTVGGSIGLQSGPIWDIARVQVSGHTSQRVHGPSERDGTGLLQTGQESYTVLGEAMLDVEVAAINLKAGYQRIDLPYLNSNDTRMVPNHFNAVGIDSSRIENLDLYAGYVHEIKERTSDDYESMSKVSGGTDSDEGTFATGGRLFYHDASYIGAINLYTPDTLNIFYVEHMLEHAARDNLIFDFGLQFTDQRSVGDEQIGDLDVQHYGAQARVRWGNLTAALAYTYTDTNTAVQKPWSGSPSFNAMMISDFDRAGEHAYGLGLSYDLSKWIEGVNLSARFAHGETKDQDIELFPDQQELNLNIDYRPPQISNLHLRLRYAHNDEDSDRFSHQTDFRVIANYYVQF